MSNITPERIFVPSEPFAAGGGTPPAPDWKGLSSVDAADRLAVYGYNELSSARPRSVARIFLRVLREPMFILLLACAVFYLVLGDAAESLLLSGFAIFVILLTLIQEYRSERAIQALKDLSSPRALVIRDGEASRIPGREVVPGDLFRLVEGDRVAADAVLVNSRYLSVDESILTGESYPVPKSENPRFLLGQQQSLPPECRIFSGTLVVSGQGLAIATQTGERTDVGRIGESLRLATDAVSPLRAEVGRLIRIFGFVSVTVSIFIVFLYGARYGDWPQAILSGLAAAMSLIPEEFAVILAVFFALGAWRLSRLQVLTRRVDAIERLGAASVLCVDKTGTLTINQMKVHSVWPEDSGTVLSTAQLACEPVPFDPMERAIAKAAVDSGKGVPSGLQLVRQYPLRSNEPAMSCVWSDLRDGTRRIAAKGAPETVLGLCRMAEPEREQVLRAVHELASRGLRVLGVAEARWPGSQPQLPERQSDLGLRFVGLLSLEDPIRPDARKAVQECRRAGIRVCILTGDYPETARSVAGKLGLTPNAITGPEIDGCSNLKLRQIVREYTIFARVKPEQKLRIITALQDQGERVAMTGDGVNDAPSLRSADIGVAMGQRGTDVAREASDIVLLDDRFSSLVEGIRQGRRILTNVRKALFFVLGVHVPIAGMAMLPVILHLPVFLHPAHIVFLQLIIDPAASLAFETERAEPGLMARPPSGFAGRMLGVADVARASLYGGTAFLLTLFHYVWLLGDGRPGDSARTAAFLTLMLSNLSLVLMNRKSSARLTELFRRDNLVLNGIIVAMIALFALVYGIPPLRALFRFGGIGIGDVLVCLALSMLTLYLNLFSRKRLMLWRRTHEAPAAALV